MTEKFNEIMDSPRFLVSTVLEAPIEECFAAALSEEAMMRWVPGIVQVTYDHSRASVPYGSGSERCVVLKSGYALVEKIQFNDEPTRLVYAVPSWGNFADRLLDNYYACMSFETLDDHRTQLIWECYFNYSGVQSVTAPLAKFALKKIILTMSANMKEHLTNIR